MTVRHLVYLPSPGDFPEEVDDALHNLGSGFGLHFVEAVE